MTVRVLSIANLKGGTGKTTCSVNLAAALVRRGRKVLLMDFDPQGSATVWLLGGMDSGEALVAALRDRSLSRAIVETSEGFDLVPSGAALAVSGSALLAGSPLPTILSETLEASRLPYDYVVIDCPPSAGALAYNALAAATGVLVPCEASRLALAGLAQFEGLIAQLTRVAPLLKIIGVQPAKVTRTVHGREVAEALGERYGELLTPAIPDAAAIRDSASYKASIFVYDPTHKAANLFSETAGMIEERFSHE